MAGGQGLRTLGAGCKPGNQGGGEGSGGSLSGAGQVKYVLELKLVPGGGQHRR